MIFSGYMFGLFPPVTNPQLWHSPLGSRRHKSVGLREAEGLGHGPHRCFWRWSMLVLLVGFALCPVVGLFGEVVEDVTTDRLFETMGQAEVVEFKIENGVVTFKLTLEDRQDEDEIWIVDFQPFVYRGQSPIDSDTGFLYANATGSCSNIERSHPMTDGYFEDDYFLSVNSTGAKTLFSVYERGEGYNTNGTRVDIISYEGDMGTFMNCTMSDGTPVWKEYVSTDEIVYRTLMYVTNVRPIQQKDPDTGGAGTVIAYVQSNFELMWTLVRRAILNFVIASQAVYKPKMLSLVGRVIVEFDFAIVEPFLLSDGSIDPSRVHLEMGISTYTPLKNTSLLVFWDETTIEYVSEDPGNRLVEVLKWPSTFLLETPHCTFYRDGYCRQQWEFEFVLEMSLESLTEDDPLDAGGDFNFQYESYLCDDYTPSFECVAHDLPLWNVTADLTLQTIVDVVDEDLDVVKVSIVSIVNDKGEDLRGGSGVRHMENVTLEVNFSPAFLRDRYDLDLSLFMLCMGEDASVSSRGCLSTGEMDRYTAFLSDDFELEYDPMKDPLYQQSLITTTVTTPLHWNSPTTNFQSTVPSTRFVYTDVTMRYSLIQDETTGSISLLPANEVLPSGSRILTDDVFLQVYQFPLDATNEEYAVFKVGSLPAAIISKENRTEFASASDQLELYQQVFDAMPSLTAEEEMKSLLYSAYAAFPGCELTYIGFDDPALLSCGYFSLAEFHLANALLTVSPYTPDVDQESIEFLRNIKLLYHTLVDLTVTAKEYQDASLTANDFMMGPEWNDARAITETVADISAILSKVTLETVWSNTDGNLLPVQNLVKSYILTKPLSTSQLIGVDLHDMLNHLKDWLTPRPGMPFNLLMATVIETTFQDPSHQDQVLPLHVIFRPTFDVLEKSFPDEDIGGTFPELVSGQLGAHWTFYDLLLNLTVGYNGRSERVDYLTGPAGRMQTSVELTGDDIGYEVVQCRIPWDYYSNIWVYRESKVVAGETLAGGWDHWAEWSSCSATCAGGVKTRSRVCLDTTDPCTGSKTKAVTCNELPCGRYKNENGLVQSIFLSELAMTYHETVEYCLSQRASLIESPTGTDRDSYLQLRITSQNTGDVWVNGTSLNGDCSILRSNGQVLSVSCTDKHYGFCVTDFVVFVEAFAGNGQSLRDLLFGDDHSVEESTTGQQHFVDYDLRRDWNIDVQIDEIKVEVFEGDELVVDLRFDGRDTKPSNWFKVTHLVSSWPYVDMVGSKQRTHLTIYQSAQGNKNLVLAERRLGTCRKRTGWLVVVDERAHIQCDWQDSPTYPLILYSTTDHAAPWQSSETGKATRVLVSLRHFSYEGGVTVPPPEMTTVPAPISYSAEMVPSPEEWQQLNYQGYDDVRQIHTSEFTNLALSGDRAVYTMTAIYAISDKPGVSRKKRRKRNLVESIQYPKVKALPYRFMGCPNNSMYNSDRLRCECQSPGFIFSHQSLTCERIDLLELPGPATPLPDHPSSDFTPRSTATTGHGIIGPYSIMLVMLLLLSSITLM